MQEGFPVKVKSVKKDDAFIDAQNDVGWTAVTDAREIRAEIRIDVRFPDGGISTRVWDDPNCILRIERTY